ncbi:MAG: OsmC family protein [Alphaproteobacteria bacterium]|uniref:OsmC family protein n=1 Tax=Candidatus Nitrobium versatile TaxID=2884831 RepID=A0A953J5Q6_9BACT|nr:OsmC family protein [Candidatus Nitrobium versatile]
MSVINGLETEKLLHVVDTVKKNWEIGKTVWKASTKWKGGFKVETCSREFTLLADEPEMLCGTNTAANPVEMVLQAYGACLTIGYAMNAAVRGIKIDDVKIDLEGEIDLPGFLGLEPPESLHMDKLPGFKTITATVKIKADADESALRGLHEHVFSTSPVGLTLSRPVKMESKLEVC